jgi:DNA-binding XRE family transcriptional regulator
LSDVFCITAKLAADVRDSAPGWQGLSSRFAALVGAAIRPFDAVHMTAGHDALRGSGPDQTRAFDNASTPDTRSPALGLTQEALGKKLGVSFQQVQKYEKGVNRVSAARLFEICRALKVPLTTMFERDPMT